MNLPFVSDSEAFLLGTIAGECQTRRPPLSPMDGDELVELRLRPFVPQLWRLQWRRLDSLPDGATEIGDGVFQHDDHGMLTVGDDGVFEVVEDESRKSLTDLITGCLEATNEENAAHLLRQIAVDSCCDQRFADGERFGQLLGFMLSTQLIIQLADAENGDFAYSEHPITKEYESERRALTDALCKSAVLEEVDAARLALKADRDSWCETFDEYALPNGRIDPHYALMELDSSLQTYWLCVGMIFRHLQDFPSRASGRPLPRHFLTPRATSVELLRAGSDIAARSLHAPTPELRPDQIVFYLITGLEPLTRALWPDVGQDFGSGLYAQIRDRTGPELKFASIANTLFRMYRNDAIHSGHELHKSVRTEDEAM